MRLPGGTGNRQTGHNLTLINECALFAMLKTGNALGVAFGEPAPVFARHISYHEAEKAQRVAA